MTKTIRSEHHANMALAQPVNVWQVGKDFSKAMPKRVYNKPMNKLNIVSWLGTVSSITGSFLVAFGIMFPGYVTFAIGAVSWLIVAHAKKDKALLTLNLVFFIANLIGLYRNF